MDEWVMVVVVLAVGVCAYAVLCAGYWSREAKRYAMLARDEAVEAATSNAGARHSLEEIDRRRRAGVNDGKED